MMDIIGAVIAHLKRHKDENSVWQQVEGRVYNTAAPKSHDGHSAFPHVVLTDMGGPIHRVFGGNHIEEANVQIDVYDNFGEDGQAARKLYAQLAAELENARLPLAGAAFILVQRATRPRVLVADHVIQVNGDWRLMYQASVT